MRMSGTFNGLKWVKHTLLFILVHSCTSNFNEIVIILKWIIIKEQEEWRKKVQFLMSQNEWTILVSEKFFFCNLKGCY